MTNNNNNKNMWIEESARGSDILKRPKAGEEVDVQFTSHLRSYAQHWVNKKSYVCPGIGCPLCTSGTEFSKVTRKWFGVVIDRKAKTPKLFDFGLEIKNQLSDLAKNPKWGNPEHLEVTISCTDQGRIKYAVTPYAKTVLSAEDKKMLEAFVQRVDLNKFNTALPIAELDAVVGPYRVTKVVDNSFRSASDRVVDLDSVK